MRILKQILLYFGSQKQGIVFLVVVFFFGSGVYLPSWQVIIGVSAFNADGSVASVELYCQKSAAEKINTKYQVPWKKVEVCALAIWMRDTRRKEYSSLTFSTEEGFYHFFFVCCYNVCFLIFTFFLKVQQKKSSTCTTVFESTHC